MGASFVPPPLACFEMDLGRGVQRALVSVATGLIWSRGHEGRATSSDYDAARVLLGPAYSIASMIVTLSHNEDRVRRRAVWWALCYLARGACGPRLRVGS